MVKKNFAQLYLTCQLCPFLDREDLQTVIHSHAAKPPKCNAWVYPASCASACPLHAPCPQTCMPPASPHPLTHAHVPPPAARHLRMHMQPPACTPHPMHVHSGPPHAPAPCACMHGPPYMPHPPHMYGRDPKTSLPQKARAHAWQS